MSKSQNKHLALAIGAAVAAGSLFSMQAMASGYMQDAAKATDAKAAEGKCGEGKCGEGKCGGDQAGKHEVKSPRDAASGQASGKRQHKPHTMASMDTDKDGRLSRAEFNAAHQDKTMAQDDWNEQNAKKFAAHDLDGDGFISQAEMDKHHADMKAKHEGKCGEGKCGEGKCGAEKKADKSTSEGKCGEGKCGEGKCGGNK